MRYTIYRGKLPVVNNIAPEGTVTERIMGEESVSITFSLRQKIEFHIGDKITVYGKDYFLSADPVTLKKNSRDFSYTLLFFSVKYSLSDIQLFFYDNENQLTLPDFSIMGTAETCLDIVLSNANRVSSGWTKGVVAESEVKNVSFSESNCLEAISKIADEFKLEYWIDSDKSIHFTERKSVSGYSFEYGKAKGLKNITRSVLEGGSLVTRLYVKGADKNLPKNYRGGQKNLRIDVPFLEKNISQYGVKEHTETFSEIYPKRVGTVTAVDPQDPNRFTDAGLDFDLNAYNEYGTTVLMNGVAAKVIFQTGQLAGYRLELIEAGGFNSATKTFYLNANKDEKDLQIPSAVMRPAVGDKYILEDIMMPEVYVTAAESELKAKAQEYLNRNSKERFQYAVESDSIDFKNMNVNVQLGNTVHFADADFGLDDEIRITGMQKSVSNPYDVKFDLSEVTAVSSIVQNYYKQQEQTAAILKSIKYNAEQARRSYLFAREFHDNVFDGEGYFDMENIKPLSIETKMISLGSRLQQFGLPGIDFKLTNNTTLTYTGGKIVHQTINPDGLREWIIPANTVNGISTAFNNIYVKCQRVGTNASVIVTTQQIKVEQDPNFFHFEVGYLSSIIDGIRKIKTTYGFAQLNPAELSIGRISSPSGGNFIDLKPDGIDINGKVTFAAGSPAQNYVDNQVGTANQAAANAQTAANNAQTAANTANNLLSDIASDNKVTAGEKTPIKMEWDSITAEVPKNGASAATYGISATAYNAAHTALLNYINSVSLFVNMAATTTVDGAALRNNFGNYYTQRSALLTAISDKAKALADAAQTAANQAAANAAAAQTSANNANAAVGNLNTYIDGAFSDGMVSAAEAASIEKYINQLNADKVELDNRYTTMYADAFLAGTPKSNLLAAKNAYNTAHANLITSINTAISDKKVTPTEKADVDAKFVLYRNTLATLSTRFQEAAQTIERARVDAVQVGGRNTFLKNNAMYSWNVTALQRNGVNFPNGFTCTGPNGKGSYVRLPFTIKGNGWWTISGYVRGSQGVAVHATVRMNDEGSVPIAATSDNNWTYFSASILVTNYTDDVYNFIDIANFDYAVYFFKDIKTERGNKASAWTAAPEDIDAEILTASQNAGAAQTAANNANTAVGNLNTYIDGAFSDNIISSAEATAIEKYINQLNADKAELDNRYTIMYADTFLTGEPKTNLLSAKNTYNSEYNSLTSAINAAIADGKTTDAEKANVDSRFVSYRNALAALSSRFQQAAEAIDKARVDAVQVGGRNLILKSLETVTAVGQMKVYYLSEPLVYGETYTATMKGRSGVAASFALWVQFASIRIVVISKTDKTDTQSVTFVYHGTANENRVTVYSEYSNNASTVYWVKIEKGNRATDWTPAPEDIDAAIGAAQQQSATALAQAQNAQNTSAALQQVTSFMQTTVDGNVIATGTLAVGDVNSGNAFFSGVTDRPNGESVRIAAGKPYGDKYLSPFQVLDNGLVNFVNPITGQKTFVLGFDQVQGKVVFDIYDDNGVKIASIGPKGIEFTGYVNESYTAYGFRKLASSFSDTTALSNEIKANLTTTEISRAIPATGTNNWVYRRLELVKNITGYLYDAGRNFESAHNSQYNGYFKTQNKLGAKLDDGVYALYQYTNVLKGDLDPATNPPVPYVSGQNYYNGSYSLIFQVYTIVNGKITLSKAVTVNGFV